MSQELLVDVLDSREVHALKAVRAGEADPDQQRLAMAVIVKKLARTHDVPYLPQDTHGSAFLAGRGFVGRQILKFAEVPFDKLGLREEQ